MHEGSAEQKLVGIHSVREALRARARPLQYVAINRERHDSRVEEVIELARVAHVPVRFESRAALDRLAGGAQHQGVVAIAAAKDVVELEDLLAPRATPGLLLALDGIEDPHNLGAILRSACGAGVAGVLLPARRSVGLTDTVERVSAGALEYVPVARVTNLVRALEQAHEAGYWSVGLDERSQTILWQHDFTGPSLIVIGAEGRGLHELTRKSCDFLVSIPMQPGVASLNASAAAAIVLFEAIRQRQSAQAPVAKQSGVTAADLASS